MTTVSRTQREAHGALAALRWGLVVNVRDLTARFGLLGHLQRLRAFRANRRRANRACAVARTILANSADARDTSAAMTLGDVRGEFEPGTWRALKMLPTLGDVAVLGAGPPGQPFRALVKIAETPAAAEGLDWQRRALIAMHDDERLGDWRALVPRVLDAGETEGVAYLIEERLTGTNLEHTLAPAAIRETALREAAEAIGRLHRATAREATVSEEILKRWVSEPARVLGEVVGHSRGTCGTLAALGRLSDQLRAALEAQPITLSWVHGDYCPGNILTGPDGHISAIVDWEFAHPEDLPSLDVVFLVLTARMWARRQEFGRVVSDLVTDPTWTGSEAQLFASAHDARMGAAIGTDTLVLLCWLRHAASKFTRRSGFAEHGLWMHANVHTVLDAFAQAPTKSR